MPYINFKFEQQEDNDERYTRLLKEFDEKLERHLSDLLKQSMIKF